MRLVLARYGRPVTRVRHAGGFSFLKTRVKINSEDGFPKVRLGVMRNPLPLLLRLLSPPSSRSRRFLLYAHAGLCPASPCTPGALSLHLLLSCAITLLLTKHPPPWRFVWGGTTMRSETARRDIDVAGCVSVRVSQRQPHAAFGNCSLSSTSPFLRPLIYRYLS